MVRKECCNPFNLDQKAHHKTKFMNVTSLLIEKIQLKGGHEVEVGKTICLSCSSKAHNKSYTFVKGTVSGLTESSTSSSIVDVSRKQSLTIVSKQSSSLFFRNQQHC